MQHETFYLPYWWRWLDQLTLDGQGYDSGDVLCVPVCEKWVDADRTVHISSESLFPGQHFIWTPVNLEKGGTGKLVPLYEYLGSDGVRLNLEYITTWGLWRARQVSSPDLVPEDLKLLFTDPNAVIVSEAELHEIEEGETLHFLEEQVTLFEKHMGWSPC